MALGVTYVDQLRLLKAMAVDYPKLFNRRLILDSLNPPLTEWLQAEFYDDCNYRSGRDESCLMIDET